MDIRQLKAFVAIAESGTFTAGAVRVHVTQAAISMQIRQLENETGAQLFVRAPRRVILTEAGNPIICDRRPIDGSGQIVRCRNLKERTRGFS